MSLDRSLKTAGSLIRHRNVLTRSERVAKLNEKGKFDALGGTPLGLPKVGNRKVATGGKTPKKAGAAFGAEGAAAPAGAAPAAGAKPAAAAPAAAAGAKGKAPAKK